MIEKNYEKEDSLTFDVDAQLITELGERLVSRNHIGISELIKNAYDADSQTVDVALTDASGYDLTNSELVIADKGLGMTFDVIEKNWMTIGTSNKRNNPFSRLYGRPVTGNKGIGRFACQRLAEHLELTSCAKTEKGFEHTTVLFDWDDFIPGIPLSKVQCRYNTYISSEGEIGTTLKLKRLREHVTERDFKMILKSITLISIATPAKRKGFKEDPGFSSNITAPEFSSIIGSASFKADEKLLSSGWGTVVGRIDNNGSLNFELESKNSELQQYSDSKDEYLPLSGISFIIHIIPLKSRDGIEYRRDPTLLTNSVLKDVTDTHAGIKLYLNGFRVYPYGDVNEGDDWLSIAHDISRRRGPSDYPELSDLASKMGLTKPSRAMLNHPGTRSLIGDVVITGKAVEAFQVKMDREGLVADANFSSLKKAIRMALDWATINYEAWLIRERKKQHARKLEAFEKSVGNEFESTESRITKAINTLWSSFDTDEEEIEESGDSDGIVLPLRSGGGTVLPSDSEKPAPKVPDIDSGKNVSANLAPSKVISKEVKVQKDNAQAYLLSEYKEQEAEVEMLRAVSATAPLLFIFAHEVKGIAQALMGQSAQLKLIVDKIDDPEIKKELNDLAESADIYRKSFDDLFDMFGIFSDTTKASNKKISFSNMFERVGTGFNFFLKQFNIELTYDTVKPTWKVPKLNQVEAYSVLINLLSNSIKSLIASDTMDRKIHISVERSDTLYTMCVQDNGIGLKEEYWEKVFEARTFDPEGKLYSSISSALGDEQLSNINKGSGLGLNIVRNILQKHKGDVNFIAPSQDWNAEVKVTIGK
ncbi:sensor histidine kinase [Vibrio mediterranei]